MAENKLDDSWKKKARSKCEPLQGVAYFDGAFDFQQRVIKELEKEEIPNYTDQNKYYYELGLQTAIHIIKNLKSQ